MGALAFRSLSDQNERVGERARRGYEEGARARSGAFCLCNTRFRSAHRIALLLTDIRVFGRVVAGVFGYAWSVYLAIRGRVMLSSFETSEPTIGTATGFSLAFLVPALLSVVAIWAAVVAEEGVLWTMSIGLVAFSALFFSEGGLLLAPIAGGHLLVVALSRPADRVRNPRRAHSPVRRQR